MSTQQLNPSPEFVNFCALEVTEKNGLFFCNGYYFSRMVRATWLKSKFGELKIPKDLFGTIVDADVSVNVLDRWYAHGGLNCVYYRCKVVFGGGDDVDDQGIRAVQDEIVKRREGAVRSRSSTNSARGTYQVDIWDDY